MSDSTGSRPRRSSAGQPPAWFRPQDPPLPATPRAPSAQPPDRLPQAWPPAPGGASQPDPWAPGAYAPQQPANPRGAPQPPQAYHPGHGPTHGSTSPQSFGSPGVPPSVPEHPRQSPSARNKWLSRVFASDDEMTMGPQPDDALADDWDVMLSVIDGRVDVHRITVSSLGARSGRTTTTLGVGTALALHRRDLVTSLDADPRGCLAERVGLEHRGTIRELIAGLRHIHTASDLRRHTSMARSRLEVLAGPAGVTGISAGDYAAALQVLLTFRPVVLTDTSTDLTLPVMQEVFRTTDTLVVPAPLHDDGLRSAMETLAWWDSRAPAGPQLVAGAVVLLRREPLLPDPRRPVRGRELRRLEDEFERYQDHREDEALRVLAPRVGAVVTVPADPALAEPGLFVWDDLDPETQDAYINAAFEIARRFAPARQVC